MRSEAKMGLGAAIVVIVIAVALFIGWCMNIYSITQVDSVWTGMAILRVIGIFLFPIGGVLGYF